jgi:hypothetical protein
MQILAGKGQTRFRAGTNYVPSVARELLVACRRVTGIAVQCMRGHFLSSLGFRARNAAAEVKRGKGVCNEIDADEADLQERMIAADLVGDETRANAFKRRQGRLRAAKARGLTGPAQAKVLFLEAERKRRGS